MKLAVKLMSNKKNEQPESAFPKGVSKPALRALASVGVTRLDQLTRFTEAELLALHGMGPKAIRIIKAELLTKGKSLAKEWRTDGLKRAGLSYTLYLNPNLAQGLLGR